MIQALIQHLVDAKPDRDRLIRVANAFRTTTEKQVDGDVGKPGCGMCAMGVIFHEFGILDQVDTSWEERLQECLLTPEPVWPEPIYEANDMGELTFEQFADVFEEAARCI
jgi:hypothetical protein